MSRESRQTDNRGHLERCPHTGKRRHQKRKQALTAANITAKEHNVSLDIYKCPKCGFWHLTETCKLHRKI